MPLRLHEFFERAAQRWPEVVALDIPPGVGRPERVTLTYAELDEQASALAEALVPQVQGECLFALRFPRTDPQLWIGQLAALKAGAGYVSIDPSFPDAQVQEILTDSKAIPLLNPLRSDEGAKGGGGREGYERGEAERGEIAYVIYTSGTTGKPKGVVIEHASIVMLVHSDLAEFGLGPGDRVAQGSSASYDSSVEELWLALASGATAVILDDDTVRLGPDLVGWLQQERVTVLCPPPTLLRTTGCEDPEAALPALRLLYVGGEALPRDIADRWARGRRLVNGYGPTEGTVTSLRTDIVPDGPITIGWAVPGSAAWVLDASLEPVPDGTSGELCLSGACLARGYHNRPELTAEKFPHHPTLGRLYRTGDLVERTPEGLFLYHGRIDAQVKLRGYRVELEAIEAHLAQCTGVREAICTVQNETLVAFIVPTEPGSPPESETLQAALAQSLPRYMVPVRFGILESLPKSVGGKLRRSALPLLAAPSLATGRAPETPLEAALAEAVQAVLGLPALPAVDADFFHDLGGSSLLAAQVISRLRTDPTTAALTVRELYEARTIAALAERVVPAPTHIPPPPRSQPLSPRWAALWQGLWLLLEVLIGSALAYVGTFDALPQALGRLGVLPSLLLLPLATLALVPLYLFGALGLAVLVKRLLIGTYRPVVAPVWGSFYLRNWVVQQVVRLVPWDLIEATELQNVALRALGAKIGRRVHFHHGVDVLHGGWDLLTVGDGVSVSQDAALHLVELEAGQVVVGPITLGTGATLETRAGMGPHTALGEGATLTALSYLPAGSTLAPGQRGVGIPASVPAISPPPLVPRSGDPLPNLAPSSLEEGSDLYPLRPEERGGYPMGEAKGVGVAGGMPEGALRHACLTVLARLALVGVLLLPYEGLAALLAWVAQLDAAGIAALLKAGPLSSGAAALLGLGLVSLPLAVALEAVLVRALGRIDEGTYSLWSLTYLRVDLKARLIDSASAWLCGTLFWPVWLRAAGMRVGKGCEISTILDVVPELVEIGEETFFADGIYLGGPYLHQGTATLARVRLGKNTFLGNHAVIPAGQHLPDDILLGVCTVADDRQVRPGSSWFGLPPFELPRREIVECDRSLTHNPSPIRYASRVFWESLRFAIPALPTMVFLGWSSEVGTQSLTTLPLVSLVSVAAPCLLLLALKWLLLGRVKPGIHPLWSCWCSRWDFLYVAWGVYARGSLTLLEGTPFLVGYLRAVGMRIGKNVVLGRGFTQVVDPDMLQIDDGATVSAMFQAHTFEDRVLKIDYVRVGKNTTLGEATVPLYGATISEGTTVMPHSVVMKEELLLPHRHYAGAPTKALDP